MRAWKVPFIPEPDLSDPYIRWIVVRAGGWAGFYGKPIGFHIEINVETDEPYKVLDFAYKDTRDVRKACKQGMKACHKLGCPSAGTCLGRPLEPNPQSQDE